MGQLASGAFDGSGTGVFPGGAGVRTIVCSYDFAVQGGATGTIKIGSVPLGTTVRGGYLSVATIVAGAGATVGIDCEATSDIVTAAAVSGAPWSTTGKKAINPKANTPESSSITTTAARDILLNITAAVLTGGKFTLYLDIQAGL